MYYIHGRDHAHRRGGRERPGAQALGAVWTYPYLKEASLVKARGLFIVKKRGLFCKVSICCTPWDLFEQIFQVQVHLKRLCRPWARGHPARPATSDRAARASGARRSERPWLRTNGVDTTGAAAKGINFGRCEKGCALALLGRYK